MRLIILTLIFLFSSGCATVKDCSVFPVASAKRCKCIRKNGEAERARQCNIAVSEKFIERMKKSSGIEIVYDDATKGRAGRLSMDLDICIFRVSQELINNTLKHAHAIKITISLTEFNDKISLYYLDDGKGFDPKTIKYGAGLRNIRERVEIFNGYLSISSDHNGTEVEVEIPLKDE